MKSRWDHFIPGYKISLEVRGYAGYGLDVVLIGAVTCTWRSMRQLGGFLKDSGPRETVCGRPRQRHDARPSQRRRNRLRIRSVSGRSGRCVEVQYSANILPPLSALLSINARQRVCLRDNVQADRAAIQSCLYITYTICINIAQVSLRAKRHVEAHAAVGKYVPSLSHIC